MNILSKLKKSDENNKIILRNTFFAFLVKGASLVVSLFTTPAYIRYFNNNAVLGVWYTLLSVLIWFLNFDLGIGNGIRNNLVKDFAAKDRESARKTISSGLFSNLVVTAILAVVGLVLISLMDLNWLFNIADEEISRKTLYVSAIFILLAILFRFFLTTVSSIFYALQKSSINNFLMFSVSILQLLFVVVVRFDSAEKALVWLSFSYIFLSNMPIFIAGIVVFCTQLKDCRPSFKFIKKEYIRKVMGIGLVFFICQILYMLIMNTNDFLITKIFSPEDTTYYNFYHKITSIISTIVALALTPIWSVITKAMEERKYEWLNKLYRVIKIVALGVVFLQFAIVPCLQFLFNIWLKENSIQVNYTTAFAFACFGSVFVYSSMLSTIVCGMAKMKLQTICYAVGVVIKFVLVFVLSNVIKDWSVIVWCNTLILLPYCVAQQVELDIYIKKLKKTEEKNNELIHE